jgi:hypothetical protein
VGDALTQAGIQAPTSRMQDGSLHYSRAERWPEREDLFDRITRPADVKVGDVVERDYPGTGESNAHIEVVTGLNPFRTTGAHADGAYEMQSDWLAGTTYDPTTRSFSSGGDDIYVLRPHQTRQP